MQFIEPRHIVADLDGSALYNTGCQKCFQFLKMNKYVRRIRELIHLPSYLLRIFRHYLKDRSLLYEALEDRRKIKITSGIAQRFILGPDLRNASCDCLLKLDMPEESRLVGHADDVGPLATGRTVEQRRVIGWITAHCFSLTLEKNRSNPFDQKENTENTESKPGVKYLDLMLDSKMSSFE